MDYKYHFDTENCWYKEVCNLYNTAECYSGCLRYLEMHYLIENSGIPLNRKQSIPLVPAKQDIEAFMRLKEIKDNIVDFVQKGLNLYIYSENYGNGKTTWSIKLLEKYFNEVWAGNGFRVRGIFIHVPTFLTRIKENITKKDENFEQFKNNILTTDLVVWDDIAATKLGDFDYANLCTYIDQRKLANLSNIFTGNLKQQELLNTIGTRLTSRVWNDSILVEFVGQDRRWAK